MSGKDARSQPRLLYLVRRWFVAGRALLEDVTREHGMTAGDYTLLSFLDRRGPCSAADVARSLRITPQAATQQVAQLEAKKLVSRRENPANRRITLIEPSDLGRASLKDIDARVDRLEADLVAGLGEAELSTIRTFLSRPPGQSEKEKP